MMNNHAATTGWRNLYLGMLTIAGMSAQLSWALPPAPAVPEQAAASVPSPDTDGIGRVVLKTGEAVALGAAGVARQIAEGDVIRVGDAVRTATGTRLSLRLNNGDTLHAGADALFDLPAETQARIWRGKLLAEVKPGTGERPSLVVETEAGNLVAEAGRLGLDVSRETARIYTFNNWSAWRDEDRFEAGDLSRDWRVPARWQASGRSIPLQAGSVLAGTATQGQPYAAQDEAQFMRDTSPESAVMDAALRAASAKDDSTAKALFTRLQQAFPDNATAAYHLGRIALASAEDQVALRQWQHYAQLDPQGAQAREIGPRLTLLIHQALQDEVKAAIAAEASISSAPPEPGSIAILPFVNRGDAAQGVLSKGLTAMLISDLSKVPGVKVLERAKLQKLLDELKLSASGLVDEKTALRTGRMMKAEKIMIGDYQVEAKK